MLQDVFDQNLFLSIHFDRCAKVLLDFREAVLLQNDGKKERNRKMEKNRSQIKKENEAVQ